MHLTRGKGFADKQPAIRVGGTDRVSHIRTDEWGS
jgi:hypothetical protein